MTADEPGGESDPLYATEFDFADRSPSSAVVTAVAEAADRDPAAIDPLYNYVDPDAIDTVVGSAALPAELDLQFRFADYRVRLQGDGTVTVHRQQSE